MRAILFILNMVLAFNISANLQLYDIDLITYSISIELPNIFRQKTFNYEEGAFVSFFHHNSNITIFNGFCHTFPIIKAEDGLVEISNYTSRGRKISILEKNKMFYREDSIDIDLRFLYTSVR